MVQLGSSSSITDHVYVRTILGQFDYYYSYGKRVEFNTGKVTPSLDLLWKWVQFSLYWMGVPDPVDTHSRCNYP